MVMILTTVLDYFKTAVSLAAVGLRKPVAIIVSLIPHIIVLGAFGAFVFWNNGVVLGKRGLSGLI
jgi:alpha-1,2-glucosyltransferase